MHSYTDEELKKLKQKQRDGDKTTITIDQDASLKLDDEGDKKTRIVIQRADRSCCQTSKSKHHREARQHQLKVLDHQHHDEPLDQDQSLERSFRKLRKCPLTDNLLKTLGYLVKLQEFDDEDDNLDD